MGLLAPLYALAALAIVGPIVFHLIQRKPRGQLQFSSLMFLSASPPRLTRRSRLDNLWLLLLRILAIALIAIAFARPYVRQESFFNDTLAGRNILILFDTSASMQRPDVWQASIKTLHDLLDDLSPRDRVALYTIDQTLTPLVPLDADTATAPAATVEAVRRVVGQLKPSWRRTELADGLRTAAETMNAAAISGQIKAGAENEIVLISDLHNESELESLQGFPWPETIQLDVRQILPSVAGNARISLMASDEDANEEESPGMKVRVENNQDSSVQTFELTWADREGSIASTSTTMQVPAGQVRVLPVTIRPAGATRLLLTGDAWEGDNTLYVADPKPVLERIAFVGKQSERDEERLSYFLEKAPLSTPAYHREVFVAEASQLDLGEPSLLAVVVEPIAQAPEFAERLRDFASEGGTVIVSLANTLTDAPAQSAFVQALLDDPHLELSEADVHDFALLSQIDYSHPVFAPFADPRFNDFSKIRFWSHRNLESTANAPNLATIASFDSQSPMMLEQTVGEGRIWVLTSGWQPAASSLALSSKFVPILMGMLDPAGRTLSTQLAYEVGEPVHTGTRPDDFSVLAEDGSDIDDSSVAVKGDSVEFQRPGLYFIKDGQSQRPVAVQVPASESQHLPLDTDVFEQYGVSLGQVVRDEQRREAMRQLQIDELESKQRLWQWLIAAGLIALAIETLVAGTLSRRQPAAA